MARLVPIVTLGGDQDVEDLRRADEVSADTQDQWSGNATSE